MDILPKSNPDSIGLYIHIPFCRHICHYCDFAKTANWTKETVTHYFEKITEEVHEWRKRYPSLHISSLNIGGGTPGLFAVEYEPLLKALHTHLTADAELSLEANPNDISAAALDTWRGLGFNRLSLGVQSFQAAGLNFLKRDHNSVQAIDAVEMAGNYFGNVNLDLIYGWPGQTSTEWTADLDQALELPCQHLSLYNLTYASSTPIGRAYQRGRITALPPESEQQMYELARARLGEQGFEHEEVSNWSKPGFSCRHNWLYWQNGYFLGIGTGAHGYLPSPPADTSAIGQRYAVTDRLRRYLSQPHSANLCWEERTVEDWLTEYVGCALRCKSGIDLALIHAKTGRSFVKSPNIQEALTAGKLHMQRDKVTLSPQEWFRETAWCLLILTEGLPC